MRIAVEGDSPSVQGVSGLLTAAGYRVTSSWPIYRIRLTEGDVPHVLFDSVDCPLEAACKRFIEQRSERRGGSGRVDVQHKGGNQNDRELYITIPAGDEVSREAVEVGLLQGLMQITGDPKPKRAWYQRAWSLVKGNALRWLALLVAKWRAGGLVLLLLLLPTLANAQHRGGVPPNINLDSICFGTGTRDVGLQRDSAGVLEVTDCAGNSRDLIVRNLTIGGTCTGAACGGGSGHTIQDEGVDLTARTNLNFTGDGVACTDDAGNDQTDCTISGGGSGGHTIQDEGVSLTARTNLNFVGAGVTVTDDAGNDQTDVTIPNWAPTDAQYWVGAANGSLSAEKDLSGFTALVLNTAGTPSAYTGIDCTNQFVRDVSGAGAGTCASVDLANDVTGTLPIANGGTGQTTQTAAFDGLAPAATDEGTILVYDGTDWVVMAPCAVGQFIRWNPNAADGDGIDCVSGPNIADQDSDVTDSDNTSTTILTDVTATPAVDTWFGLDCTLVYQTAATTTGISISLFANDGTSTAAPQFFTAKFTIGGFGAAGTDSDYVAHISTPSTLITTTGVAAANTPYVIKIDMLALGHATNSTTYAPMFRSEVNLSAVTIKEGSYCKGYVLHVDS